MNKKFISLMLLPAISFSSQNFTDEQLAKIDKERDEWTKQHFASQGSPVPDGGVKVVPEIQTSQYKVFKEQKEKDRADIEKYGYIKNSMPEIQSLLNFNQVSKNQFMRNDGLKATIQEIEMAYEFNGVPSSLVSENLGYAPSVTYIKNKGWAGAMQFFQATGIGNCSYRENNLKFSHGAAIITKEDSTKDVNGKVTVTSITGKPKYGFLYNVNWYDNNFFRELKCAKNEYDKETLNAVIAIATMIDDNG